VYGVSDVSGFNTVMWGGGGDLLRRKPSVNETEYEGILDFVRFSTLFISDNVYFFLFIIFSYSLFFSSSFSPTAFL
jgi:hypothetical protein